METLRKILFLKLVKNISSLLGLLSERAHVNPEKSDKGTDWT